MAEQPIYDPTKPLDPNEQGWIESTLFKQLQALKFKGGLPLLTSTPTYIGVQGEIVEVDDGSIRKICCYMNGTWRCQTLASSSFVETFSATQNPVGTAAWEDWDISSLVESGTVYAEVWMRNIDSAGTKNLGVRKNGSSTNRFFPLGANVGMVTATVEVDSNRIIEIYAATTSASLAEFKVIGFWK